MKFGFNLLGVGPRSYPDAGRKADEAGYESVWIPEHLIWPSSLPSDSPYSADGKWPIDTETPLYDPWVSLSFIAACSQRVRLGTYIYILPLRNPFVTARAVTTLDRVSQGRVILGIGVGWFKEEFEAVGESWGDRGKRADETIAILKKLWTEGRVEHHGDHYSFGPVNFTPRPAQKPHPPIEVGGASEPALRRAARLGDGWVGGGQLSRDEVAVIVKRLRELRKEAGREDEPFEVTVGLEGERTVDNVLRYQEAGVTRLLITPRVQPGARGGVQEILDDMERAGEGLVSRF